MIIKDMKQFLVEDSEKNKILRMHKSLLEQTNNKPMTDEETLRAAISVGCLKNGSLKRQKSTGKLFYRRESTKQAGKMIRYYPDMSFEFEDGSNKGKWKCPEIATAAAAQATAQQTAAQTTADNESKIASEIKKGWKKLETLRAEGVDLNTLDRVYDTQVVGNITLYRPKGSSTTFTPNTSTTDFNRDQLAFVSKFEQKGYKLNPSRIEQSTMVKVTDKELGAPDDLFPNGLVMYYDPNKQSAISGRDETVLGSILDNQSVDRNVCRKNIDDYFKSFQRKNSIVIDPATINKAKRIVQACKDEHYGKWGIAGGGNRIDNYLDILSGNKEGGPTSYGDDSIWRIK
jgi:hypothetical protein